jgi:predicted NUDIX family NTP pyrophosphohydrolase
MPDQPTIVAAIVTSPQGVLLARRCDGKPEWTFPSGAQEVGELYADTAVRETLEEPVSILSPAIRSGKNSPQDRAPYGLHRC